MRFGCGGNLAAIEIVKTDIDTRIIIHNKGSCKTILRVTEKQVQELEEFFIERYQHDQ